MVNTEIWFIIFFEAKDGRSSIQSAKTRPGADYGLDYELLIAKFRLKLKKVGKSIRPFRYDLNQNPYNYTVEVRNRSKGLDLIDRVPENYGWRFVVRMHLTGGLLCAVVDLSGNLWPLLSPEARLCLSRGWGIQAFPLLVSHYGDKYPLLSLIGVALCFVSLLQTAILLFCISFSWGWSWFLSPVECLEPPSIVPQALYQISSLKSISHFHCIVIRDLI